MKKTMNCNMVCLIVAVLSLACVPVLAQGDGKHQVAGSYVIGVDDMLSISIGKDLDLTNTQPVRANGMIYMPLLNDVQAAGLTPMQLAASIMEKLKKYIVVPQVTVVVTQMNSHPKFLLAPKPIRDLEDNPQGPTISVPR